MIGALADHVMQRLLGRDTFGTRLQRELGLSRREIRQGRFQRSMAAITGFSAVVSGFEAYTQHQRGAFDQWLMWTPVWLTPPTAVAAGAALVSERAARRVLPVISLVSLADGVVGFVYHIRGIQGLPGGFSVGQYNIVIGPPIFAPLLTCSIGAAGILASFLRREEPNRSSQVGACLRTLARIRPGTSSPHSRLARDESRIAHGEFERGMAILAATFGALTGGEAYFEHLRGSFNGRLMWTPVWVTPPMVAAAVGAVVSEGVARRVLPAVSAVTFLDGLLGFVLHLRGIQRMPGSFANLRFNITMGPPLFAPLLFSSVGLLGLIASLLRRRGH